MCDKAKIPKLSSEIGRFGVGSEQALALCRRAGVSGFEMSYQMRKEAACSEPSFGRFLHILPLAAFGCPNSPQNASKIAILRPFEP
jgi:hypothetical protein